MKKRIITAAITGAIHTPCMSDYLPITPREIADEAVRAFEAGAAVAHIHVRNPETGQPVANMDYYREIITLVKEKCDIVLCLTTGGALGMSMEDRVKTVTTFQPELASFNGGSMNFALFHALERYNKFKYDWEEKYLNMTEDFIFPNTFKSMREFARIFEENGTRPELEVYDSGMINNIAFLIDKGKIRGPIYLQFVMGVLGGITASPHNLMFLVDYAKKLIGDFEFSVCVAGRDQFPICTQSLLLGGNVRVGLEDNLYLEKGKMAKSNAEQVTKIKRIATELGIDTATPDEARNILNLKGSEKVKM
ncbi:MAG: 3-keto-5-aminohexanoate cleavage protein [Desulfobacterales bacterium]|nr:3-keto-5-aminohexanoate cleavage protein [Desulfobacterales bacterium]